jgi:hypothetical protein
MKYIITYIPKSEPEDICNVWVEADSVAAAKRQVMREYWDVEEIINVRT